MCTTTIRKTGCNGCMWVRRVDEDEKKRWWVDAQAHLPTTTKNSAVC